MNYYWSTLDIAPTNDLKAIKRAYATQLKANRPEDNAEHFQRLRDAYEWACRFGVHQFQSREEEDGDDDVDVDNDVDGVIKVEDVEDVGEFGDVAATTPPKNAGTEAILTQTVPELELILPSIPTRFPVTFEPPPSPSFPPLAPNPPVSATVAGPAPSASAHIAYALNTEFSGRRMRSMAQFLAAFWTQSQKLKTLPEIQIWLQAQAEYESLQLRPNLEDALADAFTEPFVSEGETAKKIWPWPAVLAVAELLDWGTVGNQMGHELYQAVQLAHLQQRAAITAKPHWHQIFSKSAAAYFLLSPFSWPKTLLSAFLPRTQQIDELSDEVARAGVDPALVFNTQQIEFQRKLRRIEFNLPRIAYALLRFIGVPLLFSLLFVALDWEAPLVGLAFGLTCFALWAGFVANRLYFRKIWTPCASGKDSQAFWLGFGGTLVIACISAALASPTFALLLAGFLMLAVAQDFATALASSAVGGIVALVIAAVLWPTQATEKFVLALPIALTVTVMCLYFIQRRMPAEKLLASLRKPPARLKPVAQPAVENFNWWWIIAGIALMRLFAAGH